MLDTVTQSLPLGTAPLVPTAENGKLLTKNRIKDAQQARNVYKIVRKADEFSARDRARVQAMIDGEPPYDPAELIQNGLGEICNVNWGQAELFMHRATAPYLDLVESVDTLITTPTRFGDPQMRADWENVMAEEFTRMLRTWPEFFPRYLYLIQQYLAHGVVTAYFDDDMDWRFQLSPFGDFLVPRQTRASEEEIEVAFFCRGCPPHELYHKIKDEELAKDVGWNVAAVRTALCNAHQANPRDGASMENWEKVERLYKNGDIGYSNGAMATEVKLVHMLVKELDGSVSQYIFTEDTELDQKQFLYSRRKVYKNCSEAYALFMYGVGSNGYLHSIRGLGSKIFSVVQGMNRLRCRMYDNILMSTSIMIQPESEDALEDISTLQIGPWSIFPNNVKLITPTPTNLANQIVPGLQDLDNILQQVGGQYTTEAALNSQKERSKFEVQAQLESLSNINIAALSLFYNTWERLLKEMLRRTTREDYYPEDPGGEAVNDFKARCVERGVPIEAIASIDIKRAKVVRAIGNGSSAARTALFGQIFQLSQNFDPQGRRQVVRDMVRTLAGVEAADRYIPAEENQRPPMEAKMAMLENNQLGKQEQVPVLPSEMHVIHFGIHYQEIEKLIGAIDQGQMELTEATPALVALFGHASAHAEFMQGYPEYPQVKQALQRANEYIINGVKALQKMQRDQGEVENQTPQLPSEGNADAESKLIEARVKLQMAEEEHAQRLRFNEELTRQQIALRDATTAADIARKARA
jgi:hypothetical protein